jgi:hypothetical protein
MDIAKGAHMPTLTLPAELDVRSALRWDPDAPEADQFRQLIADGVAFSPWLPPLLKRWCTRHETACDGARLLAVVLSGFRLPIGQRHRLISCAIAAVREGVRAVAEGRESKLIYADGRGLLVFGEARSDPFWNDGWNSAGPGLDAMRYPSPADGMLPKLPSPATTPAVPPSAPAPAPATPGPGAPGVRPAMPWHTRGRAMTR